MDSTKLKLELVQLFLDLNIFIASPRTVTHFTNHPIQLLCIMIF